MVNIQDATASVSISVLAQGFADLTALTATPSSAYSGQTVTIDPTIVNTGAADACFRRVYRDNTLLDTVSASVNAGATWSPHPTYAITMGTANTVIKVESGHMVGTNYVVDDTLSVTVTYLVRPVAVFIGAPTYTPSQTVEPGTTVTIGYTVKNNGGTGTIWAGLYDLVTPTPNLIGGYWEQSINAGASLAGSVSVIVSAGFSGQILAGHIE